MAAKMTEHGAEKAVKAVANLEAQMLQTLSEIDKYKQQIMSYLMDAGVKKMEVLAGDDSCDDDLVAKLTERTYITYDIDRLREKLDKEVMNEIVEKTYTIKDFEGLKETLIKAGVKPSQIKPFISTTQKVSSSSIKRLYDAKEVSIDDLKGCYTAKVSRSIQVNELR